MFDFEIAFYLYKISRLLEIFEENKYKSRAFYKAAMAVDSYSRFVTSVYKSGTLKSIEGIGDSSARIIKEVIETGKCLELKSLENKYQVNDYSLILSYGLSSKIIRILYNIGIKTVQQLREAYLTAGISLLSKAEQIKVKEFLILFEHVEGRYLFSYIYCLQSEILQLINRDEEECIAWAKKTEWNDKPSCILLCCKLEAFNYVENLIKQSNRYHSLKEDRNDSLFFVTNFGVPVQIEFVQCSADSLHSTFVLRGDLHMHTKWSDGKHSITEMSKYANELGREYIGISDHSFSLKVARGLSEVDALQQIDEIQTMKQRGLKVLSSIEVEILKDGSLDFPDLLLEKFDYVIAGIHTYLQQEPSEMQARIEKALSNPYVNIFAHPTGKLLGRPGVMFSERPSFLIPFKRILDICKKNDVVMELNCFPERFDIGVENFNDIINSDVFISVGTDSHSAAHLNCLDYAEIMLAKYPKLKKRVINTFSYEKIKLFFEKKRTYIAEKKVVKSSISKFDFNYYFGNNTGILSGIECVIGIDLTGNEAKPSGWAVMLGKEAITRQICTDDELIFESMKYYPKVISIDSPLSYPEGRDCTDPNCDCAKYGITRYCERLLSCFGIGVYPCLIPSMVNLTNRGIALAKKFRDLGVDVIESYPGVAQDILSIRRKQEGLEHLKNSYKNFGIVGEYFTNPKISHDELDAISSALVGMFYLNNQYVPLGNEKENFLIVPSVTLIPKKPIVIGLTGEIAAGKTTLSEYLCFKHGFRSLRYSQIIRKIYKCDESRTTLQSIGSQISKDIEKQRQLSLEIIKDIELHPNTNYVIDGLRHMVDFDTLSQHFGERFVLLNIEATFTNMYHRYNKRNLISISKEEFQNILSNDAERDIVSLTMHCYSNNNIIVNNSTYKKYFESIEVKLKEILCQ